ncbi:uncharacterized protein LOC141657878 [Silene latifolia]|uniref:uncharacterized protein LOC141657878 n=1 Tax=Silene latifolia TaxID=37657 RepID=UPI003D782163
MKENDLDLQTEDNNNNMGDIKADETTSSTTGDLMVVTEDAAWGTYEELLLACAVNRHGTNTWDSIANELHIRRRFHNHFYFSPDTCRRKYVDLRQRFTVAAADDGDGGSDQLRIVEELRKLRVQQLKREVYNHDVSIVSLENKVKILEGGEKKEKNSSSSSSLLAEPDKNEPNSEPSDLRIEPDNNANKTDEPERSSPEKVLGGDSAEDRSVNESNSNNVTDAKREPDPAQRKAMSRLGDTASESKRDNSISNNNNDNNNNNNDKKTKGEQSSEVQSSASLSKKKRRRKSSSGDGDEIEGEEVSPANKRISVKSQPLIRFFDSLLSHKHASVFHRRLPSQETEKYRNVVRQYMDLDMVQSRLDRGFYCECHPKFYRDLLLIFTNAVLFYRKSSAEHIAARELRRLVMEEITLRTHKPKILPTKPDLETQHLEPVVKKPRSSTTMVVCRRRTSMQGLSETMRKKEESQNNVTATSGSIKNSNITNSKIADGREEKPKGDHYQNQKKVDGGGSSSNSNALDGVANSKKLVTQEREGERERERSSLGRGTTLRLSNNNSKKIISKDGIKREKMEDVNNKEESSKVNVDQKQDKTTTTTVLKKQGVANFLKRINQNSPSSQEKAVNNNDSDDEEEDDSEKLEVRRKAKMDNSNGKKTVGYARKNSTANKEVDLISARRISGRKGEKEVATSSRATGRPPKRKAAMISGGTPDSGKGRKSGSDKSKKKPRR